MPSTIGHNAEWGVRGFVSKITPDQKQALMLNLIQNDWKTSIGKAFVKDQFGIEVSDKGFYNWKMELKERYDNRDLNSDRPVDWSDLQALSDLCNIPVDAKESRRELFSIWGTIQEHHINKGFPLDNLIEPTFRRIKWWAYIFEYYSDSFGDTGDSLFIADMYMTREMLSDWSQEKLDREAIDKWLLLKPWSDGYSMERYIKLIKDGTIPPLNEHIIREAGPKATDNIDADVSLADQGWSFISAGRFDDLGFQHGAMVDDVFDYERAWRFLLPSQRYTKEAMQRWVIGLIQ